MRFAVPAPPGLEAKGPQVGGSAASMADLAQMMQYASQAPEHMGPTAAGVLQEQLVQHQQLQHILLQHHLMNQQQQLRPQQACGSSGEWVEAVMSAAPFLDAAGMKAALSILDKAVSNLDRVKALDGLIASSHIVGGDFTSMPHLRAAEQMKAQVFEEQRALLRQLHQLRALAGSAMLGPQQPPGLQLGPPGLARFQEPLLARPPWPQQPPRGPPVAAPEWSQASRGAMSTLSSSLQMLSNEDPDCLFIVRRINRLGFKAPKKLKRHFSSCGRVSQVLMAHSTVHTKGEQPLYPRRRPSSLGFVLMATPEGARRAHALGEEQTVDNCIISVQRFERQQKEDYSEEEEDDDFEEQVRQERSACKDGGWTRQQSNLSEESLRLHKSDGGMLQQSAFSTRSTATGDEDDTCKQQRSDMSNRSAKGSGSGSVSEEGSASRGGPPLITAAEEGSA